MRTALGATALVLYIATIWLANYLVQHVGFVSVGFGLQAPAGVYCSGRGARAPKHRPADDGPARVGGGDPGRRRPLVLDQPEPRVRERRGVPVLRDGGLPRLYAARPARLDDRRDLRRRRGRGDRQPDLLQLAFHDLSLWKGQFVGKLEMALVAIVVWALVERGVRESGGQILAEAG